MEHNHGTTSNTDEVFQTFIGETVKGILHGFDYGHSRVILVFECGWGLAFSSNGSYWTEPPEDLDGLKRKTKDKLERTQKELEGILKLSG